MILGVMVGAWLLVLAAASDTGLGPYAQFANYGILGLLAIGFFQGRIVPEKQLTELRNDRDREHGELIALRLKVEDQILPALVLSNEVMSRLARRGEHDAPLAPETTARRRPARPQN